MNKDALVMPKYLKKKRRGSISVSIAQDSGDSSARLRGVQKALIKPNNRLSPSARCLGLLITYDIILDEVSLASAYAALRDRYAVEGMYICQWENADGKLDHRSLSCFTVSEASKTASRKPFADARAELSAFLALLYDSKSMDPFANLLADARGYARLVLPPALFLHAIEEEYLTPVDQRAFARKSSKLAHAQVESHRDVSDDTARSFDRAMDAAMLGKYATASGASRDRNFVRQITAALKPGVTGSKVHKRSRISKALASVAASVGDVGSWAALLLTTALDLHENGTATKDSLAVETPYYYFRAGAELLLQNLHDMDRSKGLADDYLAALSKTVRDAGDSGSKAQALVHAFHALLLRYDMAPTTSLAALEAAQQTRVKANVIWPHEVALIQGWLDEAPDLPLIQATQCAFAIAASVPVRIGEVMRARLDGIDIQLGAIRIDLAPSLSDTPLKSAESRRSLRITDSAACAAITDWVERRRLEEERAVQRESDEGAARTSAYLFGDPQNARKLRDGGAIVRLLNSLLKAATGDPDVSFHTLRHTIASRATDDAFLAEGQQEVNQINVDTASMGQKSGTTKLINYSHTSCLVIRTLVDRDFLCRHDLSSRQVEYWTHGDTKAASFRQSITRMRRNGPTLPSNVFAFRHMNTACAHREVAPAHTRMAMEVAFSPIKLPSNQGLEFNQILACMTDLANGLKIRQVALRNRMSDAQVEAGLAHAGRIGQAVAGQRDQRGDERQFAIQALQDAEGTRLGFAPNFKHLARDHWRELASHLGRSAQSQSASLAVDYWRSNVHGEYLALRDDDADLIGMLSLLAESKINASMFQIHVNGTVDQDRVPEVSLKTIAAACKDKFGSTIAVVRRRYRAGRPQMNLVIGTPPQSNGSQMRQGAGFSMAGFHCLMWAAAVHQALLKGE